MKFCRCLVLPRRAIVIAVCAVWLLPAMAQTGSSVIALQDSLQKSIARLEPSLIPVVAVGKAGPLVVGTGFLVSRDGEFITAAHVLHQGKDVEIRALLPGSGGERPLAAVELVATDERRGLALCRVVLQEPPHAEYVPVTFASPRNAVPGTLVIVSGFPLASPNSSSHIGIVSSRNSESEPLEIAVFINEGESGAPIVRWDDGAVIGMVDSVRTASTYVGARRGVEEQNSGLALGARAEWITALMARAHHTSETR